MFHKVTQRPGKPFWFGRAASLCLSEQHVYQNENKQTGMPNAPLLHHERKQRKRIDCTSGMDANIPTAQNSSK